MANVLDAFTGGATEKVVKPLVTIVLVVIVVYFVTKWIREFKQRNIGKSGGYNGSQLDPNKNYDNLADTVHEVFGGFLPTGLGQEDTAKQLMALNDDELKFVNDRYKALFGKSGGSMYKSINDNYCIVCPNYDALLERMRRLNLG